MYPQVHARTCVSQRGWAGLAGSLAGCLLTSTTTGNGTTDRSYARACWCVWHSQIERHTHYARALNTSPAYVIYVLGTRGSDRGEGFCRGCVHSDCFLIVHKPQHTLAHERRAIAADWVQ